MTTNTTGRRALFRALGVLAATGAARVPVPASAQEAAIRVGGLASPESVLHDTEADLYLISNIAGGVAAKDGEGWISRIAPDGRIADPRWIAGGQGGAALNAPKGLTLSGDTLFVADIDTVRLFDRRSGRPMGEVPIPGATFLNDLATLPDGDVIGTESALVPDGTAMRGTGGDAVFRIALRDRSVRFVARDASLVQPNGIAVLSPTEALVASRGSDAVYVLDLTTGRRGRSWSLGANTVDGIAVLSDGTFLASTWGSRALHRIIPATGAVAQVGEAFEAAPADFGLDLRRGRVLLPLLGANAVLIRPLP